MHYLVRFRFVIVCYDITNGFNHSKQRRWSQIHVTADCLTAPNHHQNQYLHIFHQVPQNEHQQSWVVIRWIAKWIRINWEWFIQMTPVFSRCHKVKWWHMWANKNCDVETSMYSFVVWWTVSRDVFLIWTYSSNWGWNKWLPLCRGYIQIHVLSGNVHGFDPHFDELCS